MKRILPILLVVMAAFSSCEYHYEEVDPYADFSSDYNNVEPNELVSFNNFSVDAAQYEWDFGDGTYSTLRNPSHFYKKEGEYEVRLVAINGNREDYAYMLVNVYATTLEVQVVDWNTDKLVPRANVVIYPTWFEYENFGAEVFRGVSNYDGSVVVTGLNSQVYYIDVYNDYYNNYSIAADDEAFIRTLPLEHAMHNVFTAYVDYDPTSFKSAEKKINVRTIKISSVKRTLKDKQGKTQK